MPSPFDNNGRHSIWARINACHTTVCTLTDSTRQRSEESACQIVSFHHMACQQQASSMSAAGLYIALWCAPAQECIGGTEVVKAILEVSLCVWIISHLGGKLVLESPCGRLFWGCSAFPRAIGTIAQHIMTQHIMPQHISCTAYPVPDAL